MKKSLVCICAVITASIVAGFLLLCLVYCIPTGLMVDGGFDAAAVFEREGTKAVDPRSLKDLDNFTDAIMLNTASYHEDASIVKSAAEAYRGSIPGIDDPVVTYTSMAWGAAQEIQTTAYSRYWHGYLIFLKPIYSIFNYTQIRIINMVLQSALLITAALLLMKKAPMLCFPFLLSVMLLAPSAIYKSLQYSSVYYILLISVIIFLCNPGKILNGKRVIWFFLVVGIVTVYLDFLTYPTATLTVPLVLLCYREKDERINDSFKLLLMCAVMWGVGYAFMWAGKWIIAWISGGEAFFDELIFQIKFRSSATNNAHAAISRVETLKNVFLETFSDRPWALAAATFSVICLARISLSMRHIKKVDLKFALLLLVPAACSLAWVLMLTNHTAGHVFFTYRTVVPVVFCLLTFLSVLAEAAEEEKIRSKKAQN